MSKDPSSEEIVNQSSDLTDENESLIAKGKGIWPLIIIVFLVVIYVSTSVVMLIISRQVGRIW